MNIIVGNDSFSAFFYFLFVFSAFWQYPFSQLILVCCCIKYQIIVFKWKRWKHKHTFFILIISLNIQSWKMGWNKIDKVWWKIDVLYNILYVCVHFSFPLFASHPLIPFAVAIVLEPRKLNSQSIIKIMIDNFLLNWTKNNV